MRAWYGLFGLGDSSPALDIAHRARDLSGVKRVRLLLLSCARCVGHQYCNRGLRLSKLRASLLCNRGLRLSKSFARFSMYRGLRLPLTTGPQHSHTQLSSTTHGTTGDRSREHGREGRERKEVRLGRSLRGQNASSVLL